MHALVSASKANIELSFQMATGIDLAGRDVFEAVQMSVDVYKRQVYIQREAETYRKIDKYRQFPLCPLPLMPEEVVRIMTYRASKLFGNDTNIWFDAEHLRITLKMCIRDSYTIQHLHQPAT